MDSKKAYEMRKEELQWGDTLPKKEKTIDGLGVIEVFETEYPELASEFKNIQEEMYEMFARSIWIMV